MTNRTETGMHRSHDGPEFGVLTRRHLLLATPATVSALTLARRSRAHGAGPDDGATPVVAGGETADSWKVSIDSLPGPAGEQVRWVVDAATRVAGGEVIADRELEEHLDPTALSMLNADQWSAALGEIAGLVVDLASPVASYGRPADHFVNLVYAGRDDDGYVLSIQVMPLEPFGIIQLALTPALPEPVPYGEFAELEGELAAAGNAIGASIAELGDGDSSVRYSLNGDVQLALGSSFKLWVLAAVARAMDAGTIGADHLVTLDPALYSLPSGITQLLPGGSQLSVRALVDHMIAISDNTATDHLIALVGRGSVEAMLPELGVSDPDRSIPLLTTADLFRLRLLADQALTVDYAAADAPGRREILAELASNPLSSVTDEQISGWTSPRGIDLAEWYASPDDLVRTMGSLRDLSESTGNDLIGDALSISPGVGFDRARIEEIWFKGGSEPGVLTMAFLVRRQDGRTFAAALGVNDTEVEVDAATVVAVAGRLIATIANLT